ncbi:MAG: hypothetical protein KDD10_19015 [Phaeodactylibacter sp.]|nr:hypothetical protein [Phaeodactylibacter sp.]MCB9292839.1 hypothetical protein [Lewinellaceae bacterium]
MLVVFNSVKNGFFVACCWWPGVEFGKRGQLPKPATPFFAMAFAVASICKNTTFGSFVESRERYHDLNMERALVADMLTF